jgi:hypothetical protein
MVKVLKSPAESLLISSMVNSGCHAEEFGVKQEMFVSYGPEYSFVASYERLFNQRVTKEVLLTKFPNFPFDDSQESVAFASSEVIDSFCRYSVITSIQKAAQHIEDGDLDEAVMAVSAFSPPVRKQPILNDLEDTSFLDDYSTVEDTVLFPWQGLNDLTGGLRKGDLCYVAARLGHGKSWTLCAMAAQALLDGRNVRYYSLEMPKAQVMTRMYVILGASLGYKVDHTMMRDRTFDVRKYRKMVAEINKTVPGKFSVMDSSDGRISPITLIQDRDWADLTLVDYAGLMSTPSGSRAIEDWRSMGAISNALKEVALTHGLRVIAAAQINREGDSSRGGPPKVVNLAQSDALGQDADLVLTHRQMSRSTMVYGLQKNRHGVSGENYWTRFQPNLGVFKQISKDDAEDIRDEEEDD